MRPRRSHGDTASSDTSKRAPKRLCFNRSFRDEVLNANLFNSVDQAQEAADDWVQDYNEFRPRESLSDVAPMEFMPRKFVKEISSLKLSTFQ
jgi:putative transposase